jgi:IS30 family transposase
VWCPGNCESDLIAGSNNSYIATQVGRRTRYVMLAKVPCKGGDLDQRLIKQAQKPPREL